MRAEKDAMSFAVLKELININNHTMGVYNGCLLYARLANSAGVYHRCLLHRVYTMRVYHCHPSPYFNPLASLTSDFAQVPAPAMSMYLLPTPTTRAFQIQGFFEIEISRFEASRSQDFAT
jgi:hypothetical protein